MSSLKSLAVIWMKEDSSQIKGTQQCVQWIFQETLHVAVRLGARQRALVLNTALNVRLCASAIMPTWNVTTKLRRAVSQTDMTVKVGFDFCE